MRIVNVSTFVPVARHAPFGIADEQVSQPPLQLLSHLEKIEKVVAACGAFHFQRFAIDLIIALQCVNKEEVDGEPDWTSPVTATPKRS